jgi:hypothetical protein
MKTTGGHFEQALEELKEVGLLLMSDARLPNVAGLVAGEPVRGSWWSHPRGGEIFATLGQFEKHKDVVLTKLVSGKVTLVHRKLWSDLISVVTAHEDWQTQGLSSAARHLLRVVEREDSVNSTDLAWPSRFQPLKIGDAIRELEARLLVHSEEFHSEKGAHGKVLETWQHWSKRVRLRIGSKSPHEAKRSFEKLLMGLNNEHSAKGRFLWQGKNHERHERKK